MSQIPSKANPHYSYHKNRIRPHLIYHRRHCFVRQSNRNKKKPSYTLVVVEFVRSRNKHPCTFHVLYITARNLHSDLGLFPARLHVPPRERTEREREREREKERQRAPVARATNDNCAHATLGSLTPFFSNPTLVRRSVHSSNPPVRVE